MVVIAFQVFIKHTAVIARRILKYAQEQFCMWKECIFQTVKMKQIKAQKAGKEESPRYTFSFTGLTFSIPTSTLYFLYNQSFRSAINKR
jgi:hypothetical protein